jgi:acetyl esterase/lipase
MRTALFAAAIAFVVVLPETSHAQLSPSANWAAHAANQYRVVPDVTYLTASNYESKLDIYARRDVTTPQPTLVYFHGGFWAAGTKEGSLMSLVPWMEMGWNVVNVEYRLARIRSSPRRG